MTPYSPYSKATQALLLLCLLSASSLWTLPWQDGSPETVVLVTVDGEEIEAFGGWQKQGSRLVFKDRQGRLQSLPSEAVDFQATELRARPRPREVPVKKLDKPTEPVLVLDQKNTPSYNPPGRPVTAEQQATEPAAGGASDQAAAQPQTSAATAGQAGDGATGNGPENAARTSKPSTALKVISWDDQGSDEEGEPGTNIWGSIENQGASAAANIEITVRLLSSEGTLLAADSVIAHKAAVAAGGVVNFNASFETRIGYASVEFEVRHE